MADGKRRWPGRLGKIVAVAAVVVAVLLCAAKWWIVPAVVRSQLSQHLPEYWDGSADVADVEVNLIGPMPVTIRGLSVKDGQGRQWLGVESASVALSDWPSLNPKVASVMLAGPSVTVHCTNGRCLPPLRKMPTAAGRQYVDLRELLVERACVEVRDNGATVLRTPPQNASLVRDKEGRYTFSMPGHPLVVTDIAAQAATFDEDGLKVHHLTARTCGGRIAADLTLQLIPLLAAQTQPAGPRSQPATATASAPATAVAPAQPRPLSEGRIALRGVDLAKLKLPVRGAEKGIAAAIIHFRMISPEPSGVTAEGIMFVEGADLRNVPAAAVLLRRAGLSGLDVLDNANVQASFQGCGPLVTLAQTQLHLPMAAVDVEPGGTLNLWTGRLDVVAAVGLLQQLRGVLKSIPLMGLVVDMTDRLSRFRVEGKWDDAATIVITQAPKREIREGSKQFMTSAAKGSSKLGQAVLAEVARILGEPVATRPATRPGPTTRKTPTTGIAPTTGPTTQKTL